MKFYIHSNDYSALYCEHEGEKGYFYKGDGIFYNDNEVDFEDGEFTQANYGIVMDYAKKFKTAFLAKGIDLISPGFYKSDEIDFVLEKGVYTNKSSKNYNKKYYRTVEIETENKSEFSEKLFWEGSEDYNEIEEEIINGIINPIEVEKVIEEKLEKTEDAKIGEAIESFYS